MHDVTNRSRVDVESVVANARALIQLFATVLERIGHSKAAAALPVPRRAASNINDEGSVLAVTIALHLISLVEQRETTRQRELSEQRGEVESGLFRSTLGPLAEQNAAQELERALDAVFVQPVFTAHPTEARRISTLEQYRELAELLCESETVANLSHGQRTLVEAALERLFRSGEVRVRKPEVRDEQAVVIDLLTRAMPPAVELLTRRLDAAWRAVGLAERTGHGPRVSFGTWVGGDRDGHPLVTSEVTQAALVAYRDAALSLHREGLLRLAARLGFSGLMQAPMHELTIATERSAARLGDRARAALARNPEEPFRTFVNLILARLPERADVPPDAALYLRSDELLADLELLASCLRAIRADRLVEVDLAPIMRKVRVYGFHLVSLDVRQNSHAHDQAIEALLNAVGAQDTGFSAWTEEQRLALLERELAHSRHILEDPAWPREAEVVLAPLHTLASFARLHGSQAIGVLIVSMTRSLSDLLVPYLLATHAGLMQEGPDGPYHPFPVVPLFETIDDLERAPSIWMRTSRTRW